MEQAASRLAKSLQAKLFSRLAWLVWFFGLEKAWLARPKLGLACKQKKLAYVRLGLACMKAWLDKTSLNQAFLQLKPAIESIATATILYSKYVHLVCSIKKVQIF